MYNNTHNAPNHNQRHSNSSGSTRHLSPASPLVDRLSARSAHSKRTLESSDDDDENEECRSQQSTSNRQITHNRRRNKTHHTTSNSDVGNSASEDSALDAQSLVTAAQRQSTFRDDDESEEDDDSEEDSEASESAKKRRRKASEKVDKGKSDKNKNFTLRKLFVINKSEGGKGGAKKQGQVMVIDHSEDVASLFHQQQQAVALAAAKETHHNTLMPSPSAASIASVTTPTKSLGASGVSPKTDKSQHGNSTYAQKLSNSYRTLPLGQSNRVQPSPTNADNNANSEYVLPRILPPTPDLRNLNHRVLCHISVSKITRLPPRNPYHAKLKRNHCDLAKSPNLDSRRNLPPPPAPHDPSAYDNRIASHKPSPSAASDRLTANTIIHHSSLSSIRHSPHDKALSTAAATANHLKQIKQESLKTEFSSSDQPLHLHANSNSNKSPSVARRTPQQTPGAMKQFDMSTSLVNDAGKLVPPAGQGLGFKREMLGIKTEYLKVPSSDEQQQARADKDLASSDQCMGSNDYEPGQRRKRASSVNSSPYKDKKRKKVRVFLFVAKYYMNRTFLIILGTHRANWLSQLPPSPPPTTIGLIICCSRHHKSTNTISCIRQIPPLSRQSSLRGCLCLTSKSQTTKKPTILSSNRWPIFFNLFCSSNWIFFLVETIKCSLARPRLSSMLPIKPPIP